MTKRALIFGVSGQDGGYLANYLLSHGYEVIGLSRDAEVSSFSCLDSLGIKSKLVLDSVSASDFRSVAQIFQRYKPDEVYNLSGQSSVGLSFNQPVETIDSHLQATITILEVMKFLDRPIRFYNACSSECFGDVAVEHPANEHSPFKPRSPYALAKAASFWAVANYREAYGLYACSGILGNHESPLRPTRFVTQKIIHAAHQISQGLSDKLVLGNIDVIRDWGWAEEYVQAMHLMLQENQASDFVIATGDSCSLRHFVELVFENYNLDANNYIETQDSLLRPTDIKACYLDASKANKHLGWKAVFNVDDVVKKLVLAQIRSHS